MLTEEREMKREYEGDIRVNSREMEKANERKKGERREKTIPNEKQRKRKGGRGGLGS